MLGKNLLLFLVFINFMNSSQSLLDGKITFSNTNQVASVRPLSQQPKIANIKNSLLEFITISQADTCSTLSRSLFERQVGEPPVVAVIDFSKNPQTTCGMSIRIKQIKQAGGFGFIIVTDNEQFSVNHCRMYDDNNFFTGVMDTPNFQILGSQKEEHIYGSLTISLKNSNLNLLEIWTSSLNADSYDNLLVLDKVFTNLPSLAQKVEWSPRIASMGCNHGQNTNICKQNGNVASCGCNGEFCSPQAHQRASTPLVQQDIRQMLIFKQYSSKYFRYIKLFKEQCFSTYLKSKIADDCSSSVMQKLEIDYYSINKAIESFLDRCTIKQQFEAISKTQIYSTMNKDKNAFANYGRYPLLLLNKQIIEYKSEEDLSGQLCRKMQLEDDGCFEVNSSTVTTKVGVLFYVLLVLLLVGVGAAVVYFYRKKLKKDMNKQIKMQVSTAVEHYFALTEVK